MIDIIDIIKEHSLTVRCLPDVVVSLYSYREGDEERIKKPSYDSEGKIREVTKSVIFSEKWNRKMVKVERIVDEGGWWYVKETKDTNSIVMFNRKYDKFFAPTLEEAIKLYLENKNISKTII